LHDLPGAPTYAPVRSLAVTVTPAEVPYRVDLGRWDRWRWHIPWEALPFVIPLLLIGVLAAAGARIAYAATYQPLTFDATAMYGPVSGLTEVSDGFETTRWLVTAKPGATATYTHTLTNTGPEAVTLYDVPDSPDDFVYTSYAWAPAFANGPAHKLPVVIPAGKAIQLLFSIRKPVCGPDGGATEIAGLTLHYRAFGFSHDLYMPLVGRDLQPFEVCWQQR